MRVNANQIIMVNSDSDEASTSSFNQAYIEANSKVKFVKAKARSFWKYDRVRDTETTKLTHVLQVDIQGNVPHQLIEKGGVNNVRRRASEAFTNCRAL